MPTAKHRVNVTLDDSMYQTLTRLSALRGCSRSSLVRELLEGSAPMLERVVVLLDAANRASDTKQILSVLEGAEKDLMGDLVRLIEDTKRGVREGG